MLDHPAPAARQHHHALAATICNVTTGRSFFDDISNSRDRIIAHMRRDPFEDAERLRGFPAAITKAASRGGGEGS
ncbi:MAG: hypothetical protein U0165_16185 [Polyangiaceae bacterium]